MADLSQTPANVQTLEVNSNLISFVKYGETIAQGQPVYQKSADNEYYKAQADNVDESAAYGIALTPGEDGEWGFVQREGDIDVGATLTVGETYVVSAATAGGIAPVGDLTTGNYVTILGPAVTASKLRLNISITSVAKP